MDARPTTTAHRADGAVRFMIGSMLTFGVEAAVTVEMPVCQGAGKLVDRTVQSGGLSRVGTMGQPAFLGRSADHVAGQQLNLPQVLVFVEHQHRAQRQQSPLPRREDCHVATG